MATRKKKVLFIGYGSLAKSFLNKEFKKKYLISAIKSNHKIMKINFSGDSDSNYDIIVILVKPNVFKKEAGSFKKFINSKSIVISCMAGINSDYIVKNIGYKNIVRIMPNILALERKSYTCIFSKKITLSRWVKNNFTNLLGSSVIIKKEDEIDKFTAIYGSGPAFIAMIIQSYVFACNKLYRNNKNNDEILNLFKHVINFTKLNGGIDKFIYNIASKKGTTQEGLNFLKKKDVKKTIYTTLSRSYKRAKEIKFEK